jgi:chemotaxis protein histidine kinase CheA
MPYDHATNEVVIEVKDDGLGFRRRHWRAP